MQVALTTSQVNPKDQSYVIPTPEAAKLIADYEKLYPAVFRPRKSLIRHTGTIEDLTFNRPKYTIDSADAKFLNCNLNDRSDRVLVFEHILSCFEDTANRLSEAVVDCDSALERLTGDEKLNKLLRENSTPEVLQSWLEYWKAKREANGGASLLLSLKFEDVGKIGADPYVCFRRRELKQPRKTRRTDAQVMEKIRKIRYDLATMQIMLQAGIKRDKLKLETLMTESQAFEKYWQLRLWNQEVGIERPPTLPSFKAFHQQKPTFNTQKGSTKVTDSSNKSSSRPRPRPKTALEEVSDDDDFNADLVRISLPPAAIKNVQYSRPYYPFEVVKQIQSDIENVLAGMKADMNDYSADLGSMAVGEAIAERKKLLTFDLQGRQEMFNSRHLANPDFLVLRRARTGRFVGLNSQMAPQISPVLDQSLPLRERIFYPTAINHLRSIQARDCAHLNNAFVGNYNQHYIQCTANLSTPTTLPAWISATSGLLQANKKNTTNSSSNNNNNSAATPNNVSPKKKRPAEGDGDDASKRSKSETVISELTSSPQFTVKVKSRPGSNDSIDANVLNISSLPAPTTPPDAKKATSRFTPTGLKHSGK